MRAAVSIIETLGIDIAKNVFQLRGVNRHCCAVLKRRVTRDQLQSVLAHLGPCTVVVEPYRAVFRGADTSLQDDGEMRRTGPTDA